MASQRYSNPIRYISQNWVSQRDLGIAHIRLHDTKLTQTIAEVGPVTFQPHTDYYATLVDAIVGQQLSGKAADTIMGRVKDAYDGIVPSPSQILDTSDQELRDLGLSWAKASYLKDLALAVEEDRLNLSQIADLEDNELISALTAIKGIGEWTAQMFLIFCLGRLDILPTGDLGIQKGIQRIAGLDHLPKPAEMTAIAQERGWEPYRSIACWYLWRWLDSPPDKSVSATS